MRRRQFLQLVGASGLASLVPTGAWALPASGAHRFLFIYCEGGWDHLQVFTPIFSSLVERLDPESVASEVGGLPFVDHPDRESVRDFLTANADRTAFLHGMESRSVTHEVCQRLIFTGTTAIGEPDWATRVARGHEVSLPAVAVSGPSYPGPYGEVVVRLGADNQLARLVEGSWAEDMDLPWAPPAAEIEALEDALARSRSDRLAEGARSVQEAHFARAAADSERRIGELGALEGVRLSDTSSLSSTAELAFTLFEQDVAVSAAVKFRGLGDLGFDTHAANNTQSDHFQLLFEQLSLVIADLDSRTGSDGAPLSESTTLVVFSEMGRHPQMNDNEGRDHWTFTPAMLVGGGIKGGASVGGYDDSFRGQAIDLRSGEVDPAGELLLPGHLGATLLALGGGDPETEFGVSPVEAILE